MLWVVWGGVRTRVFPLKTVQCYGQTSSYGAHGAYPGREGWLTLGPWKESSSPAQLFTCQVNGLSGNAGREIESGSLFQIQCSV